MSEYTCAQAATAAMKIVTSATGSFSSTETGAYIADSHTSGACARNRSMTRLLPKYFSKPERDIIT